MRLILLLFSFISLQGFANTSYQVKSTIKNVVVYQQGAQIKRQGNYSVKKGITELRISGVSPQIDPATLQINATGRIVIIDTKHSVKYPEPALQNTVPNEIPPKIKREILLLQDSLFELSYDQSSIQNKINVLNSQKRIIENNGTIKGLGRVNDSIPLLRDALTFYSEEMNRINASLLKLNKENTLLTRKQTRMNLRLTELNNYNNNNQLVSNQPTAPIHEIIITVSASETTSGRVSATYLVNSAGWTPLYDLRSTNQGQKIELTYKAQVYQQTGINWDGVKLNLSTNNPYTNKTKPCMNPWFLDYYQANLSKQSKDDYNDASVRSTEATSPGRLYAAEKRTTEEELESVALTADKFMTTVEQLVSVEYAINLPYSIKSDNKKNMVLVKTESLKTDYMYYTVPKIDPSVYLIAQITDLDALNLIPGKATIFHEGSYLGNTYINPNSMKDTMDLSLGKTNNIFVKRNLMKKETKEKIVGDKITRTYAYSIQVKNLSKTSLELIIEDQVPLSRNPEIEIEIETISKGKLDERNGFVTWKTKLKPSALNSYELIYTIRHQKNTTINLASTR